MGLVILHLLATIATGSIATLYFLEGNTIYAVLWSITTAGWFAATIMRAKIWHADRNWRY